MDWDKDGALDIISGCYWSQSAEASHLQFLKGNGVNDFAKPVALKSSSGEPLLNVPHKDVPKGQRKYDLRNICTHQFIADIDDDGDLDLIVGNMSSSVILHENMGSEKEARFEAYGKILFDLPDRKTSPFLFDWDGDGDLDFITGGGKGAIFLALNEGDSKSAKWNIFKEIISKDRIEDSMSKACVFDWNNDGMPDIIVGTRGGTVKVFLQKAIK